MVSADADERAILRVLNEEFSTADRLDGGWLTLTLLAQRTARTVDELAAPLERLVRADDVDVRAAAGTEGLAARDVLKLPATRVKITREAHVRMQPAASNMPEAEIKTARLPNGRANASDLPADVALAARLPANHIGQFIRISSLGEGGMGVVCKAWDTALRRFVALKFPKGDAEEHERLKREAQLAAGLDHENIAHIYSVQVHEGRPFVVMQFIDGDTLKGPGGLREVASYVAIAARAVHYAHEKRVIHRDLKPTNIMIRKDGKVFVLDFGLARQVGSVANTTSAIVGTPAYMSPDQARGKPPKPSDDVYSLGAALYSALTGKAPFAGGVFEVLHQVVNAHPESPRALNPLVSPELEAIVLKSMEKSLERRYATARDLADDIDAWCRNDLPRAAEHTIAGATSLAAAYDNAPGATSSFAKLRDEVFEFAFAKAGLDRNNAGAKEFATEWLRDRSDYPFASFVAIYKFAYHSSGMNMAKDEALALALRLTRRDTLPSELEALKQAYEFAWSRDGMNKTRGDAARFATEWIELRRQLSFETFKKAYLRAWRPDGLNKSREEAEVYALDHLDVETG